MNWTTLSCRPTPLSVKNTRSPRGADAGVMSKACMCWWKGKPGLVVQGYCCSETSPLGMAGFMPACARYTDTSRWPPGGNASWTTTIMPVTSTTPSRSIGSTASVPCTITMPFHVRSAPGNTVSAPPTSRTPWPESDPATVRSPSKSVIWVPLAAVPKVASGRVPPGVAAAGSIAAGAKANEATRALSIGTLASGPPPNVAPRPEATAAGVPTVQSPSYRTSPLSVSRAPRAFW